MARQLLVVAITLFAIVGMTFAVADPPVGGAEASLPAQGLSTDDSVIGSVDDDAAPDAAPVGGPVSQDAFPKGAAGPAGGASDASSLKLSFTSASAILTTIASAFIFTVA